MYFWFVSFCSKLTQSVFTSEDNADECENMLVAERAHDLHFSHEIFFCFATGTAFEHFDRDAEEAFVG
jgi:hypothetical protein